MRESDLPGVMEIEERCYEFPWSFGVHRDCLRVGYSCWVLELEDRRLGGYGVMSLGAGEAHLLNLCVDLGVRGQGWARRFLEHLLDIARERHAEVMLLEVRPSNAVAIRLYETAGFSEVGLRKAYYPARNGREDAILLALDLLPSQAAPEADRQANGSPDPAT
jgi:[ribosomal protein S18]-alanine N-acetyltransferase